MGEYKNFPEKSIIECDFDVLDAALEEHLPRCAEGGGSTFFLGCPQIWYYRVERENLTAKSKVFTIWAHPDEHEIANLSHHVSSRMIGAIRIRKVDADKTLWETTKSYSMRADLGISPAEGKNPLEIFREKIRRQKHLDDIDVDDPEFEGLSAAEQRYVVGNFDIDLFMRDFDAIIENTISAINAERLMFILSFQQTESENTEFRKPHPEISQRHEDVKRMHSEGHTIGEMTEALNVSEATIKRALRKLGLYLRLKK